MAPPPSPSTATPTASSAAACGSATTFAPVPAPSVAAQPATTAGAAPPAPVAAPPAPVAAALSTPAPVAAPAPGAPTTPNPKAKAGEKKAETAELEEAECKAENARKKVEAAQKELNDLEAIVKAEHEKAGQGLFNLYSLKYQNMSQMFQVLVDEWRGAVSHLNSLRSRSDNAQFDMMVARSPVVKHMRDAITSVEPDAVTVWDFCHPTPELSKKDRQRLRKPTALHYGAYKNDGNLAMCQLSRQWGNSQQVTTNHLLGHKTRHHMRNIFEFDDINDKRNLLLLSKGVEKAFETGRIYFDGEDDRTFVMKILDETVKDEFIFEGSAVTIGSLEGKKLRIPRNVDPPFKRVLSHHAQDAYRKALERGFITSDAARPNEYGSPLRNNMLAITQATTDSINENDDSLNTSLGGLNGISS